MLDRFRGISARVLRPLVHALLRAGISPNAVSWVGTAAVVAVAVICFPHGWLWQGAVVLGVLVFADQVDGLMAREGNQATAWGAVLDSSLDRVADAAILGSLAWHLAITSGLGWAALAVGALVAALLTSYVKARGEGVGAQVSVGVITRADRIAIALVGAFLAGLQVPWALEAAMLILVIGGTVTVGQRLWQVRGQSLEEARVAGGSVDPA